MKITESLQNGPLRTALTTVEANAWPRWMSVGGCSSLDDVLPSRPNPGSTNDTDGRSPTPGSPAAWAGNTGSGRNRGWPQGAPNGPELAPRGATNDPDGRSPTPGSPAAWARNTGSGRKCGSIKVLPNGRKLAPWGMSV